MRRDSGDIGKGTDARSAKAVRTGTECVRRLGRWLRGIRGERHAEVLSQSTHVVRSRIAEAAAAQLQRHRVQQRIGLSALRF